VVVSGFRPKCYKTHTCTGGQKEREGEGKEARERGRRAPLPPKCYKRHTCNGRQRKKWEREEGR